MHRMNHLLQKYIIFMKFVNQCNAIMTAGGLKVNKLLLTVLNSRHNSKRQKEKKLHIFEFGNQK